MLVLALDTTTRHGSCAVVHDGLVLREETSEPDRALATRLPADLMQLLARSGLHLHDIDAFAVATGPGSFTGIRIGIAAMQGLAFATRRPLHGVSALDALASASGAPRVTVWMDAWRGEVFAATYTAGLPVAPPVVERPAALLAAGGHASVFVGDGAGTYRDLILTEAGAGVSILEPVHPALAGTVGQMAWSRAEGGEQPGPEAIHAVYVRRPDAVLARDGRRDG